ncbi:alpha/beta hydrolase [Rhodococcus opacus]|uniref:alpha/beta hydrolase n=1 Tax=Rhodococcus opacus TaxID=37919 RepID=UPI002473414A|nr:alpha/beta hydrolase [Rhodococcus opacus]
MSERTFDDKLLNLFNAWTERMQADPEMPVQTMRDMHEAWHTVATEPTEVWYEDAQIGQMKALWCIPQAVSTDHVLLFFHAGAFVLGSPMTHRKLAGHIAKAVGARALVIDYRLAPENVYPAQLEDSLEAFSWLVSRGYEPNNIISAGDSAGGTLALALVEKLKQIGSALPGAVFAISPGLDWEMKWLINEDLDAMVSRDVIAGMTGMFIGNESLQSPLVNPIYANLRGFPPIYLAVGGNEVLLGAAKEFNKRASDAGVDVVLDIARGRQHIYTIAAGNDPVADETINSFARWVHQRMSFGSSGDSAKSQTDKDRSLDHVR